MCRARLAQYVCLLCAGLTQLAHEVVSSLCMYKENVRATIDRSCADHNQIDVDLKVCCRVLFISQALCGQPLGEALHMLHHL